MARKALEQQIATTFLTGTGLEVSQRITEEMLTAAMAIKPPDLDRVEALGKIRGDLRKLADRKEGE